MRSGRAGGGIGSVADLREDLQHFGGFSVAILLGNTKQYSRYQKNMASMVELEQALNDAGHNGFFLFVEDDVSVIEDFDGGDCSAYNVSFADIKTLSSIDIFLVIEIAEFTNFLDFPQNSKVVIYAHNLGTLYAHERNEGYRYWLCGVLSDIADYYFLPSSRLSEVSSGVFEKIITDYYPQEVMRGKKNLSLIAGGYFNLDHSYEIIKKSDQLGEAVVIAPTADWEYSNEGYLLELINKLAQSLPEVEIIVRPFPGDEVTFARLEGEAFSENVAIDRAGSFAPAAAKSALLISDPASNIKLSYAFSSFKPVIEYNPASSGNVEENITGYIVNSVAQVVDLVVHILREQGVQSACREKIRASVDSRVANFTTSINYFVDAVPTIAQGESKAEWIDIPKNVNLLNGISEKVYIQVLERNFKRHNNPYGIVYCYRMLVKGLELFPDNPALYYYIGKCKWYWMFMPDFEKSRKGGYYFSYILQHYPEYFKSVQWEICELAELFEYRLAGEGEMSRESFISFMSEMLRLMGGSAEGRGVLGGLLQK